MNPPKGVGQSPVMYGVAKLHKSYAHVCSIWTFVAGVGGGGVCPREVKEVEVFSNRIKEFSGVTEQRCYWRLGLCCFLPFRKQELGFTPHDDAWVYKLIICGALQEAPRG
ncbi:hypothetical protein CEXT_321691 [Caerostris extrusa]|uniref:Uncharacterized protein n=1 Tax=Caerostris extrusa TaxID=172846 RepID=A0AAV4XY94_CAEEX|nr:hypothetical protein CEXT_321691 [Caerostris extrusa]